MMKRLSLPVSTLARLLLVGWAVTCAGRADLAWAQADGADMNGLGLELTEVGGQAVNPVTGTDRTRVVNDIREGTIPPEDQAIFDNFLRSRIVELTKTENRDALPRKRDEIKKRELVQSGKANVAAAHDYMNKFYLVELPKLALDKRFHPATRANALLLLGNLDEKEPDLRGDGAVPLPAVRPILVQAIIDKDQPDYIKVAAMSGLLRHAELSAGPLGPEATQMLVTLVESDKPQFGASAVGSAWLRRRAAQALGSLVVRNTSDVTPAAIAALVKLMGERDPNLLLARGDAALALGAVTKKQLAAAQVDPKTMIFSCAQIVVDLGQLAGNTDRSLDPDWAAFCLSCVKIALVGRTAGQGILAATTGDVQALGNELVGQVDTLLRLTTSTRAEEMAVRSQIQQQAEAIQRWMKAKGGDTPAPGAATAAAQ